MISFVYNSASNGLPLAAEKNDSYFKILFLDTGLFLTMLRLNPLLVEHQQDFNLVNQGSLAEQFIGQQLYQSHDAFREPELYYWAREKKAASSEVDFIIAENKGRIVPVEVKSGRTGSLRSLQVFSVEKASEVAVRFNSDQPSVFKESRQTSKGEADFVLVSLPHYLVQQSRRLLDGV